MIKPINGHVLIEPIEHDTGLIATQKQTFEEIGIVVDYAGSENSTTIETPVRKGTKVYFDAWLAVKYPHETDKDKYYWLVKYRGHKGGEQMSHYHKNSQCRNYYLHDFRHVKDTEHGFVERCTRCGKQMHFKNNMPNHVFLSYHNRSALQSYEPLFKREYPNAL